MINILHRKTLIIVFGLISIIYLIGAIFINVMDIDAAQYASMSWQMMSTGNYLQVFDRGTPYLDKPPILFWLGAMFFKLFGINHFVYRLPSILFSVLGIYSTFKLGKHLHNKKIGVFSAIILSTSQGFILFNHDVKTDTILTNAVIFSIWQIIVFFNTKKTINFILAFVGVSIAMLSKGPIGIMVPILSVIPWLIYNNKVKELLHIRWFFGIIIVLIILSPMLIGLYQQYGWEGIKFYFWTQSFGRITGDSEWRDDTGVFFFVHTFLWAFMPWMFLAIGSILKNSVDLLKRKKIEIATFFGFILPFIALSTSNFKLPHYINVVFPLAAIFTAKYLYDILESKKNLKLFFAIQIVINITLWILVFTMISFVFPTDSIIIWSFSILGFIYTSYLLFKRNWESKIFSSSLFTVIIINITLNAYIYPELLKYQQGNIISNYVKQENINNLFFLNSKIPHSVVFYTQSYPKNITKKYAYELLKKNETIWVVCHDYEDLSEFRVIKKLHVNSFRISMLNVSFLNPEKREEALTKEILCKITKL